MIFTLVLCLGVMAAATAAQPTESSEVPKDLDMMALVNVSETLVVYKRKHTQNTTVRCLSAKKKQQYNTTLYEYILRGRNPNKEYGEHNVNVTLQESEGIAYKSTYISKSITYTLTLKANNATGSCFVIFTDKSDGNKGCELLVLKSKVDEGVPRDCRRYYKNNCNGTSIKLHRDDCDYN
uniref:Putative secreted protein n=1 Tax=Amblyomma cajennense TaxID=34607 RepID=A0A023FTK2_AMBCJ